MVDKASQVATAATESRDPATKTDSPFLTLEKLNTEAAERIYSPLGQARSAWLLSILGPQLILCGAQSLILTMTMPSMKLYCMSGAVRLIQSPSLSIAMNLWLLET
jgi:hypothetical protein